MLLDVIHNKESKDNEIITQTTLTVYIRFFRVGGMKHSSKIFHLIPWAGKLFKKQIEIAVIIQ